MTGKKIGRRELFKLLPGAVVAAVAVVAAGKEDETVEMILQVDSEELAQAILDAPLTRTSVGYAAPPFEFGMCSFEDGDRRG